MFSISDSDILAAFRINYRQFLSFLPDVLYTIDNYYEEIEQFAKDLKACKRNHKKIVDISWGRMGKVGIRICGNFGACGIRAYTYPEEASTMPRIRETDILSIRSGTGTTRQVVEALDLLLGEYSRNYKGHPKIYTWTHDLKSILARTTHEHDGTVIYVRGEEEVSKVVKDFYERQLKDPLTITPMGTRDEFNHMRLFDYFTPSLQEFLKKRRFSFEPFKTRFTDLCTDFSILEESLSNEVQQEELINSVHDLVPARRLILIADAYTSVIGGMIADRARNVFSEDVDIINFDSSKRPISRLIIPGTKVISISKTGESKFTLEETLNAKNLGASYTLITENPKAKLAKDCNKKIVSPNTEEHWRKIGKYLLRTEEIEMSVGDCLLMAAAAAKKKTEAEMLDDHVPGYKTSK